MSRRAVGSLLLQAGAFQALAAPTAAHAFFESPTQLAVNVVATAQPKVTSMVSEVAEVSRKRKKMAADYEDDAYVIRFARSVLDPASASIAEAAPSLAKALGETDAGAAMTALPAEFKTQLGDLYTACRAQSADDELEKMRALDDAIKTFLASAAKAKQDIKARDDINAYNGASGVLYNKFLFRAG